MRRYIKQSGKTIRRGIVWMLLFSMVFGYFTITGTAATESVPHIEGDVVLPLLYEPNADYLSGGVWGSQMDYYISKPGTMNVILDNAGCNAAEFGMDQIKSVKLIWENAPSGKTKEYEVNVGNYRAVEKFNILLVDAWYSFRDFAVQLLEDNSIRYVYGLNELSKEQCEQLVQELPQCRLSLEIRYQNDVAVTAAVNTVWTDSKAVYNIHSTVETVVINLADSSTIDDVDFYELDNAIAHMQNNTYYVDLDSEDNIVLPMDHLSVDAVLTKLKIGPETMYDNAGASVYMEDSYTLAGADPEKGRMLAYEYTDKNGVQHSGYANDEDFLDLGMVLYDVGLFGVDGELVSVADYIWKRPDGTCKFQYIDYRKAFDLAIDSDSIFLGHENDFINILENGYMIASVPNTGIPGTVFSEETIPQDTQYRFHIVFVEDPDNLVEDPGTGKTTMQEFIEALKTSVYVDGSEKEFRIWYELLPSDKKSAFVYSDLDTDELRRTLWYSDTRSVVTYSDIYDGDRDHYEYNGYKSNANILYSLDYKAYDYDTLEYILNIAQQYGIEIDGAASYMPDYTRAVISDERVWDHFSIQESYDTRYRVFKNRYTDEKILGRPAAPERQGVAITSSGESVFSDREGAVYSDHEVSIPVADAGTLDKGVAYNVTAQIMTNNLQHIGSSGFIGEIDNVRGVDYGAINYRNGELIRNSAITHIKDEGWQKTTVVSAMYTEYKWGEMILASHPSVVRNLAWEDKDRVLSWDRPEDEGLGVENGAAKRDEYIYLQTYTVNVYDDGDQIVYTITFNDDRQGHQSVTLPEGVVDNAHAFRFEVLSANALGSSIPAEISREPLNEPEDPKDPEDSKDPEKPSDNPPKPPSEDPPAQNPDDPAGDPPMNPSDQPTVQPSDNIPVKEPDAPVSNLPVNLRTGDDTNSIVYIVLAILSAAVMLTVLAALRQFRRFLKENNNDFS